jgi:hypothetical protein
MFIDGVHEPQLTETSERLARGTKCALMEQEKMSFGRAPKEGSSSIPLPKKTGRGFCSCRPLGGAREFIGHPILGFPLRSPRALCLLAAAQMG